MTSERLRRMTDGVLVAGEYSANAVIGLVDPRLRGLTATPAEARMPLPGDRLVPWPSWRATRAVTIEAPPSDVWPWLAQAGYGRGGWYADMPWWRDEEGHRGARSSSDRLIPEEQHVAVGQVLLDGPGCDEATGAWRVVTCRPGAVLVLFSSRTPAGREVPPGTPPPRVYIDCSWAFVLRSMSGATRLIVRSRAMLHPDNRAVRCLARGIAVGDEAMQRAMLLGIKRRVEESTAPPPVRYPGPRGAGDKPRGNDDKKRAAGWSRRRGGDADARRLRGGSQPGHRRRR